MAVNKFRPSTDLGEKEHLERVERLVTGTEPRSGQEEAQAAPAPAPAPRKAQRPRVGMTFTIDAGTRQEFKMRTVEYGTDMTTVLNDLIAKWLSKHPRI